MASTPYIVTKGIVLRETETKESDKILTLLTAEYGKISVIARGARRKSCKFAAAAQHLVWSEWTLYRRGEWYYANEGTTLELFAGLRADLDALALGCYFAELTEAVTSEEVPAEGLLRHLLNGLYALGTLHKPPMLVKAAFEMKLLCLLRPGGPGAAAAGRGPGRSPLPALRRQGEYLVHAAVCQLSCRAAAYHLWGPKAALFLHVGRGSHGTAGRGGGGFRGGPTGAWIPNAGFL